MLEIVPRKQQRDTRLDSIADIQNRPRPDRWHRKFCLCQVISLIPEYILCGQFLTNYLTIFEGVSAAFQTANLRPATGQTSDKNRNISVGYSAWLHYLNNPAHILLYGTIQTQLTDQIITAFLVENYCCRGTINIKV